MIAMPKSKPVFSTTQQSQFKQLQLEVAALEEQLEKIIKEQWELTNQPDSQVPIPLIQVNEQLANTGIRLSQSWITPNGVGNLMHEI